MLKYILIIAAILLIAFFIKLRVCNKPRGIRIVIDERDNDTFFKVIKMFNKRYVQGVTYDDSKDVICMDVLVKAWHFKHLYQALRTIQNIEIAEVR